MAAIDVSELMDDPDFGDNIVLYRRFQTVDTHGETVITPTTVNLIAIVQAGNGETLKRNPEYAVMEDWITIYAIYHFKADGEGYYPDKITWNARNYLVKTVTDYSNWGAGYTRADCLIEGIQ